MVKNLLVRLFYGLLFAVPLMVLSFALAQAKDQPQSSQPEPLSCPACHESHQVAWESGVHSKTTDDPAFQAAMQVASNPEECLECHVTGYNEATGAWAQDGVSCAACHDTTATNHPVEPMAADRSASLCGDCHSETYFEWQVSAHRASGLDCVGCHDPHGTSLKAQDVALQCATCHRTRSSNFAHSEHSTQGLTCVDCHLAELPDPEGQGHARLDHSFQVRLSTCNECHAYQMHDPSEVHPESTPASPEDAMAAVESLSVMAEPVPVSPVGFATLSGLFGLAAGVILAPWLARRRK